MNDDNGMKQRATEDTLLRLVRGVGDGTGMAIARRGNKARKQRLGKAWLVHTAETESKLENRKHASTEKSVHAMIWSREDNRERETYSWIPMEVRKGGPM